MSDAYAAPASNPFATRWTRPGALPYRFEDPGQLQRIVQHLAAQRWRGAIIGPHGSGKSTLLTVLLPELLAAGRRPVLVELHDGQRQLDVASLIPQVGPAGIVLVDGYEQLGWWSRWRLNRLVARSGAGLLVTAHRPTALPTIWQSAVDLHLAQALVQILVSQNPSEVTPADVQTAFEHHPGNLREIFFELYDLHEQRPMRPKLELGDLEDH